MKNVSATLEKIAVITSLVKSQASIKADESDRFWKQVVTRQQEIIKKSGSQPQIKWCMM